MITINDKARYTIRQNADFSGDTDDLIDSVIEETMTIVNKITGDDRLAPPEPVNHPRTATITKLDGGSYLLVIQNGDCIASVTMTTP